MKPYFNKTAILGVGLIGASLAMALRRQGLTRFITGFGRKKENLKRAKRKGIIDSYELDPAKACEDADLIVLATPPGAFLDLTKKIRPSLKKGAIVMDVGSVKGRLTYRLETLMPKGVYFVGAHPIAGGNRSGIEAADPGLFKGALCIVSKTKKTKGPALRKVNALWKALGSTVREMPPEEHDRVYGLVSHLPHLLAYALVNTVADVDESLIGFAGPGFRDTTRIAGSPSGLWADIAVQNKKNLLRHIDLYTANLLRLKTYLKKEDRGSLEREFKRAQTLRERMRA